MCGRAPDPWGLRACDVDRDRYLQVWREAYAEGRLDAFEHEERMQVAMAAKVDRASRRTVAGATPSRRVARQPPHADHGAHEGHGVFNSVAEKGAWRVLQSLPVIAVASGVKFDLTRAVPSGYVTEVTCVAVMGEVSVIVPRRSAWSWMECP